MLRFMVFKMEDPVHFAEDYILAPDQQISIQIFIFTLGPQ